MYGAILGDIIGSPYEFSIFRARRDFPLFSHGSTFTDDTVMTLAVADAFLDMVPGEDESVTRRRIVRKMQYWGRRYPDAGYGARFIRWLDNPVPYGSWGNGSAMRVSAAGWLFDDLRTVRRMARLSALVSHNHPEGIKGAEATASAIFLARTGASKAEIRDYIAKTFGYDLSRTCDQIRPAYHFAQSCQETVPEAITAFLDGHCFEDAIRNAVSLGGDSDTLAAIAGSIAEGFYGVPEELKHQCRTRLTPDLLDVLNRFDQALAEKK